MAAAAPAAAAPVHVPKPDRAAFEKKENELKAEIESLKAKRERLNARIDAFRKNQDTNKGKVTEARNLFNELRGVQQKIKEERNALLAIRDATRAQADKLTEAAKGERSKLRFGSLEEVERRLAELEERHATTSLSLREEKDLIKEIETLSAQKRQMSVAVELASKANAARATLNSGELKTSIDALTVVLKAATEKLNEAYENLKGMEGNKDPSAKDAYPNLIKERNDTNDLTTEKFEALKKLRDDFYAADKAFHAHMEEVRRVRYEKQRQEREEREKRLAEGEEAALAATTAEVDPDMANYSPWAAELAECDNLIKYLINLKPKNTAEERRKAQEAEKLEKERKEKALAQFVAAEKVKMKAEEEDGYGALAKKGNKKNTKQAAAVEETDKPLYFPLATLDIFRKYDIPTPATTADLDAAIFAAEAKRRYYESAPAPAKAAPAAVGGVSAGAAIVTPYGKAVVSSIRGDGCIVCKMTGFEATAYLQKDQVKTA